ncbi:hypothetical protein V6N11_064732 [Hibiscus sabdariffa]|uniref:Uncharacterized protein n=1 Tax=Hibiscus sabdariffa TaxID=183260 RepID=A0ABR2SHV3_9ROSI
MVGVALVPPVCPFWVAWFEVLLLSQLPQLIDQIVKSRNELLRSSNPGENHNFYFLDESTYLDLEPPRISRQDLYLVHPNKQESKTLKTPSRMQRKSHNPFSRGFNNLLEQDDKGDVSTETTGPAPAEVSAGIQISAERLLSYWLIPKSE